MTFTARHLLFAALLGLLLGALAVRAVYAATSRPASEPRWVPVHVEAPSSVSGSDPDEDARQLGQSVRPAPQILDPFPVSPPPERAAVEAPAAELVVREKATPRPKVAVSGGVSGIASYYAWHVGEAAAGPALRVGNWRGRVVTVCTSACITVRLTDWCQCYGSRVIDLDTRSFAALAPLSAGLVTVTVRW